MNRKQRRKAEKIKKDQTPSERNLSEKIFMFDQIPDACTTCAESFDKTDKSMAFSWRVVVHQKEQQVRLFCPTCIQKTQEALEKNG
tara:strand:- start:34 stop:291 length:258 start_codon:yes stop_codon:yes gene_type:complete